MWNYYKDKQNSGVDGENNNVNYSIKDSKPFDYKTSITGKLEDINTIKDSEIVVPLKNLSNFWRALDMPSIKCKINLILVWKVSITSKETRNDVPVQGGNPAVATVDNSTNAAFKITDTKLYILVVTLSTADDNNFLEQLKSGFQRTTKWNKYRS